MGSEWHDAYATVDGLLGTGCIVGLLGHRGSGKTQLACEAVRQTCVRLVADRDCKMRDGTIDRYNPPREVQPARYITALDVFLRIRETFKIGAKEGERSALTEFLEPSLLVIDEIQERGETPWEDRILTYLIDQRYGAMTDTLIVGNLKPSDLVKSLGASIASRIQETGTVIECNWESYRAKAAKP